MDKPNQEYKFTLTFDVTKWALLHRKGSHHRSNQQEHSLSLDKRFQDVQVAYEN